MFENSIDQLERYIALYNQADVIIVPSNKMLNFLQSRGLMVNRVVVQRMWDYPVSIDQTVIPGFRKRINFAADVIHYQRQFVQNWNSDEVELAVTANLENYDWAANRNINFLGWYNEDHLLVNALRKSGGFGLLWHDLPWWCEYMKLNASYKLGSYLAAGIPVIVPSWISEKETILRKNLGIAVNSLDEAVDKVKSMDAKCYNEMVNHVETFSVLIRNGYFTKKLLVESIFKLLHD